MTPEDRLRLALIRINRPAPDNASSSELMIRAARALQDHAERILAGDRAATERALPSNDAGDPWRVGATVQEVTLTGGVTGKTMMVQTRETGEDGTERATFGYQYRRGLRKPGAPFMQIGPAADGRYAVPAHFTPEQALAAIPTPRYTGKFKVFSIRQVSGPDYRHPPHAYISARSWTEVAHLCAQQGLRIDLGYHRAYSSSGDLGGAGPDAARAHPGILMVVAEERADQPVTMPYQEYARLQEAARDTASTVRRATSH